MRCDQAQASIEAWNPLADLDDDVVGHMDRCDKCRASFDQRFPSPVPPRVDEVVVVSQGHRGGSWVSGGLVAAAAIAFLAILPSSPSHRWTDGFAVASASDPPECHFEPWHPPECPTT